MSTAWAAALVAQAALAMRLPPGQLHQFHAWQATAGVILFVVRQSDGPYTWALAAFWVCAAVMLLRATPPERARLWIGLSSLSIAATVAWQAREWGALSVHGLLAALPHFATAYALCFARGWMLAFLLLRWGVLLIGWHHGLTPTAWQAHQRLQARLFVVWAANTNASTRRNSG